MKGELDTAAAAAEQAVFPSYASLADELTSLGNQPLLSKTSFNIRQKCGSMTSRSKGFTCPTCSQTFATRWVMTRHMLVHSPNKVKCQFCDKMFTRKDNLNHHVVKYHSNIAASAADVIASSDVLSASELDF